jgi:protein-disulfide isomerase
MRTAFVLLLALTLTLALHAQSVDDVLATATGHIFKFKDLSAETQKLVADSPANYVKLRANLYEQFVALRLMQAEAAARHTTTSQIIIAERNKIKDPTQAEIKKVFDENQAQLAGKTLEQVRKEIVAYLRYEPEQKALTVVIDQLRPKYKFTRGKDVNAPKLLPTDIIGTVNGRPLTVKEYDDFARFDLFEARDQVASAVLDELNEKIQTALGDDEAKARGIDSAGLIAGEITDKMKEYTDEERDRLALAFFDRLYTKYKVKFFYKGVAPVVENVSVDDDPSTGPATAPVTVIMFSDFQCPACSAIHPLLKQAMAAYPGKIRFVVRDCPLETVHEHAYRAALAAYAAQQQGKFFEYTDLLYTHQSALDDASLKKYAADLGLNATQFALDFMSEKAAAEVKKDITDGENIGIHSTPTIFINGIRARLFSVAAFQKMIGEALAKPH